MDLRRNLSVIRAGVPPLTRKWIFCSTCVFNVYVKEAPKEMLQGASALISPKINC